MKVNNQNQYIRHIAALQNPSPVVSSEDASNSGSDDAANTEAEFELFETAEVKLVKPWGGKLRRLRQSFVYPNVGLKEALTVWYYGGYYPESCLIERELCDGERVRFPPLRLIKCNDLERRNHGLRSKWFKVLNAVTNCTSNIPEKPSVKQMVTIMEAGKHMVMAPSLAYDVDQTSNSINTMYDYLRKNEVSRTTGTHKRKNIGSSSSRSQSLPRKVNKKKKNRLRQFQQFLDKREQGEISV